jgi:hypothetical protein
VSLCALLLSLREKLVVILAWLALTHARAAHAARALQLLTHHRQAQAHCRGANHEVLQASGRTARH